MRSKASLTRGGALLAACLVVSGLAASTAASRSSGGTGTTLTVYSGREEAFVKPLYERFTQRTGIQLRVRYGDSAALAATIEEEGGNSPADVFFSQDAGALGAIASRGRLEVLPRSILGRVPRRFRAPGDRWVGVSGRARVIAYNTDALRRSQVPRTIWGLTQPRWRGKVGLPPTNASFQAFVTAMRLKVGDARTRRWLLSMRENDVRFYARNSVVLQAVANREIELGLVNHYYLYQLKEQQPNAPVANYFLGRNDPGALINVAGAGVVSGTDDRVAARRLLAFLVSREAQRYFAHGPGRAEYPLVRGVKPRTGLPSLTSVDGARITLNRLGRQLPATLRLLNETGYTR
jgi:iron(III) transport system substrate-binding protein